MIVSLRAIAGEARRYEFSLPPEWWPSEEPGGDIRGLAGPLEILAEIYRAGSKFVVEGRFSGTFTLRCARCLVEYEAPLSSEFRVFLAPAAPQEALAEYELTDEDALTDFIQGDEVDLAEIVREQILLALPMVCVCRPECAGLCAVCGGNRNQKTCRCGPGQSKTAFAKLKGLRLD